MIFKIYDVMMPTWMFIDEVVQDSSVGLMDLELKDPLD